MSVSFTLEKRTNLHDECPIRLSWSFMGERCQSTLGVSIKKEDWNEKSRLVKADTHNHNGQNADEINFLIKRISTVVMDVELACIESQYILGKDMMKQVIHDALSNDIACPEDIVERCINGIMSTPEPKTRYYCDLAGRYYQFLCDAKNFYTSGDNYYILQELFGSRERVAVPISIFKPEREKGSMYSIIKFKEVSKEEAFGR
ncbi:MAG: hypothetical protein IJ057_02665 [Bacteroidales bacterium]|nr:hypothetical protein [Bacteroidales bacterium]